MNIRVLICIAGLVVVLTWIGWLGFNAGNEFIVDGITVSAFIVTVATVGISSLTWFLLSLRFGKLNIEGVAIGMVVGLLVITPVSGFLGPMAAVIVGIVSGFISFMIQKKIVNPSENKPLIIAGITLLVMYAVLTIIIQLASSSHIWDTGDGIGAWTGTPEGIEKP